MNWEKTKEKIANFFIEIGESMYEAVKNGWRPF